MRIHDRWTPAGGHGRATTGILAALGLAVLVLGACGERTADESVERGPTPSVSPAPTRTSGPLGDGFEVEPGSAVVGDVFPHATAVGLQGGGWSVLLRVDRDAHRIFNGYIRQAERLGRSVGDGGHPLPDDEWCSDTDSELGDEEPDPFPVRCFVFGEGPQGRHWTLTAYLQQTDEGYLLLTDQTIPLGRPEPLPPIPDGPVAAVTEVEVAPGMTPESDDAVVRIVEGSALIAEPLPVEGAGGYHAVLEVTGDLPAVMRAYEAQFTVAESELRGNESVLSAVTGPSAGAGGQAAIAVVGHPSYLFISRVND